MIANLRLMRNEALMDTQKRFFQVALSLLIVLLGVRLFIQLSDPETTLDPAQGAIRIGFIIIAVATLYIISQGRYIYILSQVIVVMILLAALNQPDPITYLSVLPLLIITSSLFANTPVFVVVTIGMVIKLIEFNGQAVPVLEEVLDPIDIGLIASIIVGSSAILRLFAQNIERLTRRESRTTSLLQATSDVGQITTKLLDLDELFEQAVDLIRDRFAYYHVQVFLVDGQREYAELVASTGQVGRQLIQRGHKLAIGSQSVIGRVTQVGEPVVARASDTDGVHARNELLPNTRAELALPIVDGDRIIGALDVQSTRSNAFDETDIQALQIMANQLAVAIRNARLFEAKETSLQENKRLFLASETNLREIKRLNQQLISRAWGDYLKVEERVHGVTIVDGQGIQEDAVWSATMLDASAKRRPAHQLDEERMVVAVPIELRGEVLGVVEVETDTELRRSDVIDMMQTVAQRLAISLDNSRLFQEAQETTAQEQLINDIVSRYQSADTVDDLLEITLAELSETLGAQTGSIRLTGVQSRQNGNNNGHQNGHNLDGDQDA